MSGDPQAPARVRRGSLPGGIAVLTFDAPGSSANVFNAATLGELERHLDAVAAESGLSGLVFATAKPSIFVAGADLHELASADDAALAAAAEAGQRVFGKVEAFNLVTVAAIHGACLGGGLELALACDWRLASPDRSTRIGLPETRLGILPAWGGSTRLPRLVGLPAALDLVLAGKQLRPEQARRIGLVDGVVHRERLLDRAAQLVAKGRPDRPRRILTNNLVSAALIGLVAKRRVARETRGNYPAAPAAVEVMTRSVSRSQAESLRAEREALLRLAKTPEAKQLMRLFFLQERAKKAPYAPGAQAREVRRVAVVGAGVMGAGIAQWTSARGIPVVLRDVAPDRVAAGMQAVADVYRGAVKRRLLTQGEAERQSDLITPSATPVPLGQVDLVIEAAVEKLDIKAKIFADLCTRVRHDTVLATNTSALPVTALARAGGVTHPERVIGIHFFNPVHQMQLVEVVVAGDTSDSTVESVLAFVRKIGKLPVVVRDSPGFLVNRLLMPYLTEAGRLFERGVDAAAIDGAMLDFGMPMGPLRLLDEVGLDIAAHVAGTMAQALGDRFSLPGVLGRMVEAGLLGRKAGRGFYLYGKGGKSTLNPEALAARGEAADGTPPTPTRPQIAERLALLVANEGFRVLDEKVAASADDIDLAMVLGTGFAPFRGGPMAWAESIGRGAVREKLARLEESDGPAFAPAEGLRSSANMTTKTA